MRQLIYGLIIVAGAVIAGSIFSAPPQTLSYGAFFYNEPLVSFEIQPIATSSRILFSGDVMLARRVETIMRANGPEYVFARMPSFATSTDFYIVNFEASVPEVHKHTPDLTFRFSVAEEFLPVLSAVGVTHASLGNNHSYDTGSYGFNSTYRALLRSNVVPFGDQKVASSSVVFIDYGTVRVAIASVYAVDRSLDQSEIAALMRLASSSDVQIAYVHWGTEYKLLHSNAQEVLARALIDAGVDAIIGHHPHVVQDIGIYDGVPIFYSLGNFVFDQYFSDDVQEGLLVQATVTEDAVAFSLLPHTERDGRSQPRLMTGDESRDFLRLLAKRSEPSLHSAIASGTLVSRVRGCNSCIID